jgi:hypothetical protein
MGHIQSYGYGLLAQKNPWKSHRMFDFGPELQIVIGFVPSCKSLHNYG